MLHAAASDPEKSRGRRYSLEPDPARNQFQRDRDRIVHSAAFRRLVYKTQVFLNHEGDLFRTRLTHSLEVAQIARSIARDLCLHEDLVEAIALAHDLGHTPFGHAGQDALDESLRNVEPDGGGFEHNLQSLRVVDELEDTYAEHHGLNLCFETREGILKHCSRPNAQHLERTEPGGVGSRFLLGQQPSLEGQLCNLADEIAYNAHDIDDGVRSGLLTIEQVAQTPLFGGYLAQAIGKYPHLSGRRLLHECIRRMLSAQIRDVQCESTRRLEGASPRSADEVRRLRPLIAFSADMRERSSEMKRFLRANLYRHPQVTAQTDAARQIVRDLFQAYLGDCQAVPTALQGRHGPRAVADYIAGMTDRFAVREHVRLTGQRLFPAIGDDR
jgi:dGTPase